MDPVVNIRQAAGRPAPAEVPPADPHHAHRWWILAVLGSLLLGGRIADLFGRKWVFLARPDRVPRLALGNVR